MKLITYLLLIGILVLNLQCKKEEPAKTLPPISQEGKNVAGFLMKGEVWVPFSECGFFDQACREIGVDLYKDDTEEGDHIYFTMFRDNKNGKSSGIYIRSFKPITSTGNFSKNVDLRFRAESQDIDNPYYRLSSTNPIKNFIVTKLDYEKQIISGTFSCTLINPNGEIIEITEGRFDFKMNACVCSS